MILLKNEAVDLFELSILFLNEWNLDRELAPAGYKKSRNILNVFSGSNVNAEYRRKYIKNGWRS